MMGGSTNERPAAEWATLMKEQKAKQRATEEVSQLRYELNTLRRTIDASYVKKKIHEQRTAQLQGRIQSTLLIFFKFVERLTLSQNCRKTY